MIGRGPGLIGMAARTAVVAGTATAVSGSVHNRQAQKQQASAQQQADAQQQAAAQQQALVDQQVAAQLAAQQAAAPAAAPAANAGDDLVAQLSKLADLKAAGVLSDAEFAEAKAKLLAGSA